MIWCNINVFSNRQPFFTINTMPLLNPRTLVTALLLAPSFAFPASESSQVRRDDKNVCNDGNLAAENPRAAFFRKIVDSSAYTNHSRVPTPSGTPLKVGIIGAGAAGLYAAILLDSLGIEYDIHEVSDRIGGRIYTYRFDQDTWANSTSADPAYYDYYVSNYSAIPVGYLTLTNK